MRHSKKRILSALLAAALLLPIAHTLSADTLREDYSPYAWENTAPVEELSRKLSDYTGAGTVIAVIDSGFDPDHPVFQTSPENPAITSSVVAALFREEYYISEKIPFAYDYAHQDGDVVNLSPHGTSAASLAGGFREGAGDQLQEDGTVLHDPTFAGSAPDAQLLFMKAAEDGSAKIDSACAGRAILDALRLGANAIVIHSYGIEAEEDLAYALEAAAAVGVPVFCGAGDLSMDSLTKIPSVLYTDRSTLTPLADLSHLTVVGAAGDPYRNIRTLDVKIGEEEYSLSYTDSCEEYFGVSFAGIFAGMEIPVCPIEGVGRAEDYEGIDAEGKLAVVQRGEISFVEKTTHAAKAGAVGLIVVDTGDGVSRMALEEAPIPAVMVDLAAGEILSDTDAVLAVFPKIEKGVAPFSANGVSESLTGLVDFVCDGEGLTVAVSTALAENTEYMEVSGTAYAAASAAGFAARCAQYCRTAGFTQEDVLPLLIQSATLLRDGDGNPLSPRLCGAGYVSDSSVLPSVYMINEEKEAVTGAGSIPYRSAYLELTVINRSDRVQKYTVTASVTGDGYEEKDGKISLTGKAEILPYAVCLGDSLKNINEVADGAYAPTLTLDPGEKVSLHVRLTLTQEEQKARSDVFQNGFFTDGFITLTGEAGDSITHPFTAFFGDWTKAPLADVTVYEDTEAVLTPGYLSVHGKGGQKQMIGVKDPASVGWDVYSPAYNIMDADGVNTLYLHLSVLRRIDSIRVRVFDGEGRCVYEREDRDLALAPRSVHPVALWNFAAEDNSEYLFPDGEYRCEIRLKTSFGKLGSAENVMNFPLILDRVRPDVVSYSVARDESGKLTLEVEVSDDRALGILYAYDGGFSYLPEGGMYAFSGDSTAHATMDLSLYDYLDPLYIEVSDYAGNVRILRIPAEKISALTGAE